MEPPIRYVRSADGTRIAYASAGEGPVLVRLAIPGFDGSQSFAWDTTTQELTEHFTVVRYDCRGSALSERNIDGYSLDAMVADLGAVARAFAPAPVALSAVVDLTPVALRFAAENPEIVSHLVLYDAFSRAAEYRDSAFRQFDRSMENADWDLYLQTFLKVNLRLPEPMARAGARMINRNISRDLWWAFPRSVETWDVDALLRRVRAKTLLIDNPESYVGVGARMAADIPDSEFRIIDNRVFQEVSVLTDFILRDTEPEPSLRSGMTAILFLDIADSTALTERLGDTTFRTAARELDERAREAIRGAGGIPVEGKVLGDGVMAAFTSAAEAIDGARRCFDLSADSELKLHIGVHAGDVMQEGNTLYGGTVNIAARICGLCEPGEILVSATVRDLARTSAGVTFADRGEHALKGIQDRVRLFAVG